jgi:hypothetical protein
MVVLQPKKHDVLMLERIFTLYADELGFCNDIRGSL